MSRRNPKGTPVINLIDWILNLFRHEDAARAFVAAPEQTLRDAGLGGVSPAQLSSVAATAVPGMMLGGGDPVVGLQRAVSNHYGFAPATEWASNNDWAPNLLSPTYAPSPTFAPQTDLAILNYICNYIIQTGKVNQEFVKKNVNFKIGETDIGFGLRPAHALEKDAKFNGYPGAEGKPKNNPNDSRPSTFEEFKKFVSEYTVEKVSKLSGVPVDRLKKLAEVYADPKADIWAYAWAGGMMGLIFLYMLSHITLRWTIILATGFQGAAMFITGVLGWLAGHAHRLRGQPGRLPRGHRQHHLGDRKSTRLNSSH